MSTDNTFFEESTEHSQVKAKIVATYFAAWANVIVPQLKRVGKDRIGYFDLFAGTGTYADGTKSTPLLVLENAARHVDLRRMLVSFFNDKDPKNCERLKTAISAIPGIDRLQHQPSIHQEEVGAGVIGMFKEVNLIPSIIFLDPWGYKGLCLDLVNAAVKDWACECIFFFNYLRINPALENEAFKEHMDGIFGSDRANSLRDQIKNLSPLKREELIMNELVAALSQEGRRYVLCFKFRSPDRARTSHYLVFVTKHFRGYEIMKDIMAKASSRHYQDVPSYEFDPRARNELCFDLACPLDDLIKKLPIDLAGKTLTTRSIFEKHCVGTPYVFKNYKAALTQLEILGQITADPPSSKRRAGSFSETVVVKFPLRTENGR
jgi:three-Cys-motif partner protein